MAACIDLTATSAALLAEALRPRLAASRVLSNTDFGARTTYRVGGLAGVVVEVGSIADLATLAGSISHEGLALSALGRGSNLLVSDDGFPGVVVAVGDALGGIDVTGPGEVRVGAGATLPSLARQLTSAGLRGFEWAVGVPGSVGGAVRMNAGGHGDDMSGCVRSVTGVDVRTGDRFDLTAEELEFGYRTSSISQQQIVVTAELTLAEGDPVRGRQILDEIVRWRRENQPGGQNAGSVFTNPEGDSAGRIIEAAGLKGLRVGSAEVSAKHANFIQADVGGRAADVVALMMEVARRVFDDTGLVLEAETRLVGFGPTEHALMFDPRGNQ